MTEERIKNGEIDADDLSEEYLDELLSSIQEIECLVYTGSEKDVAWILQGVRHLSGIRDWSPAQKAELIAKEHDSSGLNYRAIGEMLGMTAHQVGRLYRAHHALAQMRRDDEFGSAFKKDYFTILDEAYSKIGIRKWLGWDEKVHEFANLDNLRRFYSWITPNAENNDERRIHDPRQMKILNKIVDSDRIDLLAGLDEGNLSLEQIEAKMQQTQEESDWRGAIRSAIDALNAISATTVANEPNAVSIELKNLQLILDSVAKVVDQAQSGA
ncbi:hypothetical protein A6I85_19075 [Prescottella equi]|nr:hypothetical protein A6I85_19075 [Prescottella equi]